MEDIYESMRSFILFKLRVNSGSQVGINSPSKEQIIEFCKLHNIETKNMIKEQMIEKINEQNINTEELINYFKKYLGIPSIKFQEKFGVEHKIIKKLEAKGLLKVIYKERTRAYGKYIYVPQYDASVYFDSKENFQKLLDKLNS